ncbi:MAG TPA: MarR family transcriptional regulator [Pseudomonadales bacterium]|nr:MarR family transcriptional regulator [Pseudomonadales bacterium]
MAIPVPAIPSAPAAVPAPASDALLQQTVDKFWESIPPVWNRVRINLRTIATDNFGISVEQFHILRHIRKGFQSVSELAEVRQISRSAVSQAVDSLVEKGLVTRQQSTQDRRYVRLELTQSGNDLLNMIFQKNHAWMAEKLAGLNDAEVNTVIDSMEVLKRTFIDE